MRSGSSVGVQAPTDDIIWKKVALRPLAEEHTDLIVGWRNSPHVRSNLFDQRVITREQHLAWLESGVRSGRCAQYLILANGLEEIGTTFLKGITSEDRVVEFGIFIGETGSLGKGYGKCATEALVRHAFLFFQVKKVWLEVMEHNTRAVALYTSLGFVPTDSYKKATSEGRAVEVVRMEIRQWHDA